MNRLYGLIGYPLGHSFSERYFAEKFSANQMTGVSYRNFPLERIDLLPVLLREHPDLCGFNVTIPYKEQVIPYLDRVDDEAVRIGAVNCVRIDNGKLTGYNADIYGFENSLLTLIGTERPAALVLGSGGASKAVKYVLTRLGMPYKEVSRTKKADNLTYGELTPQVMTDHRLIVNTTPLGTFPDTESAPDIPYGLLSPHHFLFDLVYNPPLTRFLASGQKQGAAIQNGYDMLVGQAEKSWEIWTR